MRYGYDRDVTHLAQARPLLAKSVEDFARLTQLTDSTYRDAAGMRTPQRKLPVRGGPQTDHWRELLPVYKGELATFDARLKMLASAAVSARQGDPKRLPQVGFMLESAGAEAFTVGTGQNLYTDMSDPILSVSPQLDGLRGIRLSRQTNAVRFKLDRPAQVLVGFFKSDSLKASNASADTEQWNILLPGALSVAKGLPMTVWAKVLPAGENDLDLGKGAYVVLGFIPEDTHVVPSANFDKGDNGASNIDWLFED
jgi:hypothetical protein